MRSGRLSSPSEPRAAQAKVVPELGSDDDILLERLQGFADEFFVGEWTVDLGSIKERNSTLYGRPDERNHFLAVRCCTTVIIEAHAA